jgi:zinc protease
MNQTMNFKNSRSGRVLTFAALTVMFAGMLTAEAAPVPFTTNGNVLRATLKNGLQVIIVRNTLAPVVTTVINFRVGSDETPPGFPGTAHAMEHMMFRGSPGLSADQLADIAAAMGGDFNADTQQGVTQYFFTVPAEDLDVALHIESLRMKGLSSTEELWSKERGAIEQEVAQDLSNPEYVFYMQLLQAMFKGTPYEHDALGTRPSFDKTTGADLKKFHETWYVPNNAILVVVGGVDPQSALKQVDELFGGIKAGKLPARQTYDFQPVKPQTINLDTDLPYGMTAAVFRMPGSDSPDYAALQILSDVLSSQRGKLYQLVPDGKALFAEFAYESLPKAGIGYAVAGFPAGGDAPALLEQVKQILVAETTNGVLADLVEAAKRREIASAAFSKNSVSGLAMAWSQAVAVEGRQSPDDDIEAIRRVTVDDVNRVAREYLNLDHAISAILKPQPSGKPVSTKSFGGQESFAPTKTTGVKLPKWAAKAVARAEVPKSTLNPTVTMLPNGLRLVVQPETISETISVYGRIKNNPDVETPKGKEGTDLVLEELFSYGTKTLDRIAFQKALDDIGANESAGADFSLQVLTNDFECGVQLLADNQLSPALPEEAFKIIQPQQAASIAGKLQSPNYLAGRALKKALFPQLDPVQREATPETIKSLNIDDLRNYYNYAFRPDLSTIVVIGMVTPEHARAVIEKYFGDWKATGPKPETVLPPAPRNTPGTTQVPDTSRVQDRVTLAEVLPLTRTNEDYYPLQLGNHVLGGGFYATRLYRDLREKSGLTYFVSSTFDIGQSRGIYRVDYACDPPNVSKARAIVVSNLKDMQKADVTPKELQQAVAQLLREIPLAEASVQSIAEGWLARSVKDLPLDEPILAAQRYVKLTAPEVRAAYAKWLRVDDLVQVTQGPAPQ